MGYEPRLIAPFDGGGLQLYYKPWLIGKEAFPVIQNCYAWRGSVVKREGYELLGTLPTNPVMGLRTRLLVSTSLQLIADEQLIAFSTTKAYRFDTGTQTFIDTSGAKTWTGGTDDFFWSDNFANAFWATNNIAITAGPNDGIEYFDGTTWFAHQPILNVLPGPLNTTLVRAQLIVAYKNRLIFLSTGELNNGVTTNYFQRARWCQIGTPYVANAVAPYSVDVNAWRDDIPGKGGFVDADTNERIVSLAIVNDILIVFFQKSTWRLRYTGNEVLPFIWERINSQYGSESQFSTVAFQDMAQTFSRYGFVGANTNQVARLDENIPDESFQVETGPTLQGLKRVHGIRDYYRQFSYWTYAKSATGNTTPDQVLAYNYLDGTWAKFDQKFRCFGYYKTYKDSTWNQFTDPNADKWQQQIDPDTDTWIAGVDQSNFPQIIAGGANGQVFICYSMVGGGTDNGTNFGFNIMTKRMNPYLEKGLKCKLAYVDLYCTASNGGEITIQHFVNDNDANPIVTRLVNTSELRDAKYVRIFLGGVGYLHQLKLFLSPEQIADPIKGSATFEMQGLVIWTAPMGRIKQ